LTRDLKESGADAAESKELREREAQLKREAKNKIMEALNAWRRLAQTVDLCFVLDCTNSMGKHIRAAKETIVSILDEVKKQHQDARIRMAVVAYRDIEDKENRWQVQPFDWDHKKIRDFVGALQATSENKDFPEDVQGALYKVLQLDWKAPTKTLFHITDAPCHGGKRFHDLEDDHPVEDPALRVDDLLVKLREKQIRYYFGKFTRHTDKMIREFKKIYDTQSFSLTETRMKADPREFLNWISTSISKSITITSRATPDEFVEAYARKLKAKLSQR